jgi:hypothetical protein
MVLHWFTRARRSLLALGVASVAALALVAFYLGDVARTYIIQADTHSVSITFFGSESKPWLVSDLTLCQRRRARISASQIVQPGPTGPCNPAVYENVRLSNQIIEWPNDTTIRALYAARDGGLELHLQSVPADANGEPTLLIGGHAIRDHAILLLPETVWRDIGSLLFSGYLTIGSEPVSGVRDHLVKGNYEVRETLFLRSRPVPVLRGELFSGDEVQIVSGPRAGISTVTGFMLSAGARDEGMRVVAYSSLSDAEMQINRLGATPSVVRPSWTDRALNDPALLALTGLLALIVTILELAKSIKAVAFSRFNRGE